MTVKKQKQQASPATRLMLRQASGRYATKHTLAGREKKPMRPMPSLPKLKWLEEEPNDESKRS
jgi:hypothetical protein